MQIAFYFVNFYPFPKNYSFLSTIFDFNSTDYWLGFGALDSESWVLTRMNILKVLTLKIAILRSCIFSKFIANFRSSSISSFLSKFRSFSFLKNFSFQNSQNKILEAQKWCAISINKLYFICFIIKIFCYLERRTNEKEQIRTKIWFPFRPKYFQMLSNSFVRFQTLVILFAICSYQTKRTGTNAIPDNCSTSNMTIQ